MSGKGSHARHNRNDEAYRNNHEEIFGKKDDNDKFKRYKPNLTKKDPETGLTIYDDDTTGGKPEAETEAWES